MRWAIRWARSPGHCRSSSWRWRLAWWLADQRRSCSLDWANLLMRWGHMIAGIAWIGTSFYFVALDFSLRKRDGPAAGRRRRGLGGAWRRLLPCAEISGGARDAARSDLIWFKWEAYLTWVTGFLLLIVLYYLQAETYLIDPRTCWR